MQHIGTKGAAYHSNAVFFGTFLTNFSELRQYELRRIPLPRTPVNKGAKFFQPMLQGLHASPGVYMMHVTKGNRVEAEKAASRKVWAPSSRGGRSQWCNRLPG